MVSEYLGLKVLVVFCRVLCCVRLILYAACIHEGIGIYKVSAVSGIHVRVSGTCFANTD